MKKFLSVILVSSLALCLTACSSLADFADQAAGYAEMAREIDETALDGMVSDYVNQTAAQIQASAPEVMDSFYNSIHQGYYWVGAIDETTACNLYFNDETATVSILQKVDDAIERQDITGSWTLDYDTLTILDADGNKTAFRWEFEPSALGDGNEVIKLISEDLALEVTPSDASTPEEAEALTNDYLEKAAEHPELKTLCADYEGYSVVNAMFAGGENPTFERRAEIAKALGLENYTGTAEQNLELIKLCGGTVK